jgi:outer membrane lipopolysaccharide assembly protein LptE/RlpB
MLKNIFQTEHRIIRLNITEPNSKAKEACPTELTSAAISLLKESLHGNLASLRTLARNASRKTATICYFLAA